MVATKFLAALLPSLLLSFAPSSLASPTPSVELAERQTNLTATATASIISYFVASACDSPFSQATQVIGSNFCMDLGEDDTTRSIALYNLAVQSEVVIPTCVARVWEDEVCGSETYLEIGMGGAVSESDKVCVDTPSWSDGSTSMGSVMLICTY